MIRFSIILPVRNGFPYVKECVHSILRQTYPHLELVVLDNQSKDDTVAWITSLNDPRIRLLKADRPLSIEGSWARIKSIPKQEYMTMIGHDDRFDPTFLDIIKDLIEKHPDASLYQTGSRLIDSEGKTIRRSKPVPARETSAEYLRARLTYQRDVFGTGYVMRSADYDRLGGIPAFEKLYFADDTLWLLLAKQSWKASDPREAFAVRIHPRSESASVPGQWSSFVKGLEQFAGFLEKFLEQDEASRQVYRSASREFFLRYHRNIYIYALVDASRHGVKIDPRAVRCIADSLAKTAPEVAGQLCASPRVRALEVLNGSFLRPQVDRLWKLYQHFKR